MFYDGLSGAIGTMLLANALPAHFYQRAAKGAADCFGPDCFGPTHAIIAALCGCAVFAAGIVGWRSTALYRTIAEEQRAASKAAGELL